jgi:hypothetical protein
MPRRTGLAIGLFSAALIGCQIALMQALAQAQWSHFAHMVIAVAMLGFGASGTWLAVWGRPMLRRPAVSVPLCMALAGVAMSATLYLSMSRLAGFDMMELFMGSGQWWRLGGTYAVYFVPFFLGALAIGIAFASAPGRIGQLYAWNLAGSALGGPLALALLGLITAPRAVALLAVVAYAAALLAGLAERRRGAAMVTGLACLGGLLYPPEIAPSAYKDYARALQLPDAVVGGPVPSAWGEARTVSSPALRYAPALSLHYRGEPPRGTSVFVNGNAYGVLLPAAGAGPHILDATPRGLPYALRSPQSVLVLNAGGVADVTHALAHAAGHVAAVEPHPVVRRMAMDNTLRHAAETTVQWSGGTARAWLSGGPRAGSPEDGYGLIVLPAVGEFGGDAGLQAMAEDFTLTLEAFQRMWARLHPSGMLSVSVWIDYPPRASLRLAAMLMQLLESAGVEQPRQHLVYARNWGLLTFVAAREPFDEPLLERAREFAARQGFELAGAGIAAGSTLHAMEDPALLDGLGRILSGGLAGAVRAYPFAIAPAHDDRPYFSQFLRLREWRAYQRLFLGNAAPFLEIGLPLLLLTFIQIAVLSLPLIALPLLRARTTARGFGRPFVYFTAVGAGFMLWEIVMIQRYTLYWGHPLLAAGGVISVLLLAMGAGSLASSRMGDCRRNAALATGTLALLLLAYALLLQPILEATLGLPAAARAALGVLVLLPPGFLMGMPFPLGLRWVEEPTRRRIAWAWGLDGYASVISATGAVLLAVLLGFTVPMTLSGLAYALAALMAAGAARAQETH